jgi:hypothetical protein
VEAPAGLPVEADDGALEAGADIAEDDDGVVVVVVVVVLSSFLEQAAIVAIDNTQATINKLRFIFHLLLS